MISKIEWTQETWNPIAGCSIYSPGCARCYAMRMAARLEAMGRDLYAGLTTPSKAGRVWTGEVRVASDDVFLRPLRWRNPRTIFVNSMSDLFHERVPDALIDRVFAVMALCPQHTFQVLTKRSARMRAYMAAGREHQVGQAVHDAAPVGRDIGPSSLMWTPKRGHGSFDFNGRWPLPNVWLGVSAEDQRRADERVPDLLATPAAVRFVSAEPLLGPICFGQLQEGLPANAWLTWLDELDWIIVGGESGPGARPMHPDWARLIRDQCEATGVAFHFKQHGAWTVAMDREAQDPDWRADYSNTLNDRRPEIAWLNLAGGRGFHGERFHVMRRVGKAAAGRLLDGRTHDGMPEARA